MPIEPNQPAEAGIEEHQPDLMQVEAARLLVNDAMPRLTPLGFERRDVLGWARTYVAEEGGGDVDSFIAWIDRRQSR